MLPTRKILLAAWFVLIQLVAFSQPTFYREQYRPQFHFTPAIHWTNDPNGLVYFRGEYHLFYQFNPFGNRWGHMSWGHAVSKDLVYWEHLPLAIPEEKDTMIFSGSCVVDEKNTSGFAKYPGQVPMVAIYTGHIEGISQSQHIAYSLDSGRHWTKYDHNPVLDLGKRDFRDPHVFWYEPDKKWVMAVVLPIEKQVQFYQSENLRQWQYLSVFGPEGDTTGIWECPDLFRAPVDGEPGTYKWVLMHSPAPYMQYFIGEFNGKEFVNENQPWKVFRPDYGPDYYAAITFNDLPAGTDPLSMGWVNNWNYANDIPTTPWKSMMSIPRRLAVKKIGGDWFLIQQPLVGIRSLRTGYRHWKNIRVNDTYSLPVTGQQIELEAEIIPGKNSSCGIRLALGSGHYIEVGYYAETRMLYVDRSHAGDDRFHPAFARLSRYETRVPGNRDTLTLDIFLDQSVLEVFANQGEAVMTTQLFPDKMDDGISLFATGVPAHFTKVNFWDIQSVWK